MSFQSGGQTGKPLRNYFLLLYAKENKKTDKKWPKYAKRQTHIHLTTLAVIH